MEAHVHDLHFPVQGEGEHEVVVGPVHLEELERRVLDLRTLLLVRHLQAGDVLAHLHQDVVQAAGVDIDLLHQVAHFPHESAGSWYKVSYLSRFRAPQWGHSHTKSEPSRTRALRSGSAATLMLG